MNAKYRKSIGELTNADIAACPVWEYALDEELVDGQDETTVRPLLGSIRVSDFSGQIFVRTQFLAADGRCYDGPVTATRKGDISGLHPSIIHKDSHIVFWQGWVKPKRSELTKVYRLLETDAHKLFPIQFRTLVKVPKGFETGTIDGFYFVIAYDYPKEPEFEIHH